ncbi:endothelin-2 [Salarias fasciatus]|uniref:Endothelin-2-like n=1 Tax=Salarias fasciatus TaxID=181472 RepID=A0A672GGJ9_SALFA|nr:endothelin-2-like [Salarias fasciatus]
MASLKTPTFFIITIIVILREGCGLPVSERAELPAQTQTQHPHRVRTKRCSCNNWEDKECIYFCHLDIIWVNTPNKLLPYGLGSPLSRRRRSADRCECLDPSDDACRGFCGKSSSDGRPDTVSTVEGSAGTNRNKLLASLRSVVKTNTVTAKDFLSRTRR